MARPKKEGMDYFPHDVTASSDRKIEALRSAYGNDGYAFYFIMLEQIYQEPNFELDISDAETREEIIQILSRKIAVTPKKFMQILKTALKWNCFNRELYESRGILTSNGIKKRAGVVQEKRQKMREKYQQEKEVVSDAEIPPETQQKLHKEKKSKEEERKEKLKENIGEKMEIEIEDLGSEQKHDPASLSWEKISAELEEVKSGSEEPKIVMQCIFQWNTCYRRKFGTAAPALTDKELEHFTNALSDFEQTGKTYMDFKQEAEEYLKGKNFANQVDLMELLERLE